MTSLQPADVDRLIEHIDALLDAFEGHPDPRVREGVAALVAAVRQLHTEALKRLVAILAEDRARLDRAMADPVVANLLLLHDLIAVDERRMAEAALEPVQAFAEVHGGRIELVDVAEGVVRVRLAGACVGCPSSTATLRQGVERALVEKLPGFRRLDVEGLDAGDGPGAAAAYPGPMVAFEGEGAASLVPAETMLRLERQRRDAEEARVGDRPGSRRVAVGPLAEIPAHTLYGKLVEDYPVLVVRGDADLRAYRNACPDSVLPLHLGTLRDGVVRCPWHGCRFDAATGARVEGNGAPLLRLPATVVGDVVWVEIR